MKKRVITILLCVVTCSFMMFGCGDNTSNSESVSESASESVEETKLQLTQNMISHIEEWIEDNQSSYGFPFWLCYDSCLYDSSTTYTRFLVTSKGIEDDYIYRVYGKVAGDDKYGDENVMKFSCTIRAEEISKAEYDESHLLVGVDDGTYYKIDFRFTFSK